jgi:hypothetical protein
MAGMSWGASTVAVGAVVLLAAIAVCIMSSGMAGFFTLLVVGSMPGILSGGFLQPCEPSRSIRVGPSFTLFAPGIKLA